MPADADYAWADVDDDDLDKLLDESESEVDAIQEFNADECDIEPTEGGLLPSGGDFEPTDDTEPSDDTSTDTSDDGTFHRSRRQSSPLMDRSPATSRSPVAACPMTRR